MKKSLYNFYQFLKKPTILKKQKEKRLLFKDFAALFLLDVLFTALLLGLFYILLHFNLINEYEGPDLLKEYGAWGTLAFACILAPLLEEVFFRWHLRDLYGSIYFAFLSLAGLIASQVTGARIQFIIVIISLVIAALSISFLRKRNKLYKIRVWKKAYPFLFYYTAFVFGLIHLTNYKDLTISDPSFVLYIASQTFGGLGLGYLRIKYGLIYSILFHAFFNLVAVSLIILFP